MSPRNSLITAAVFGFLVLVSVCPAEEPVKDRNPLIKFYQDHLSAADGSRCTMTPSCSEYAARAIKKHGPVIGWIMASDRLVRCGRDEVKLAPKVRIKGKVYTSDPVAANDFWWFNKTIKPEAEQTKGTEKEEIKE